ncbi:hypothetical protein EsH8_I_001105 [Colletotrichum jinshuiense]
MHGSSDVSVAEPLSGCVQPTRRMRVYSLCLPPTPPAEMRHGKTNSDLAGGGVISRGRYVSCLWIFPPWPAMSTALLLSLYSKQSIWEDTGDGAFGQAPPLSRRHLLGERERATWLKENTWDNRMMRSSIVYNEGAARKWIKWWWETLGGADLVSGLCDGSSPMALGSILHSPG